MAKKRILMVEVKSQHIDDYSAHVTETDEGKLLYHGKVFDSVEDLKEYITIQVEGYENMNHEDFGFERNVRVSYRVQPNFRWEENIDDELTVFHFSKNWRDTYHSLSRLVRRKDADILGQYAEDCDLLYGMRQPLIERRDSKVYTFEEVKKEMDYMINE